MSIPALVLPEVTLERCKAIVSSLHQAGAAAPLEKDLRNVGPVGVVLGPNRPPPPPGVAETAARYLYLNAVLDQSRDSEGLDVFLARVTSRAYAEGITFLHEPGMFFARILRMDEIIEEEHARIKQERAPQLRKVRSYSLNKEVRASAWLGFRWGTPLINIERIAAEHGGLLEWMRTFRSGEKAARAVKSDARFGLGTAIGDKAAHLFVKFLQYTARIDLPWGGRSYEVPLDSNVGRVLMRSGLLFAYYTPERLAQGGTAAPWQPQKGGRVNLAAQKLAGSTVAPQAELGPAVSKALVELGYTAKKTPGLMQVLNALLVESHGSNAQVGTLDDGLMRVGRDFCGNTDPKCGSCPLRTVCVANTDEPLLKTAFYCGTGANTFGGY